MTFKAISALIGKDPKTVSYEVKHHCPDHRDGYAIMGGTCPLLLKAPFVCNGCSKKHSSVRKFKEKALPLWQGPGDGHHFA